MTAVRRGIGWAVVAALLTVLAVAACWRLPLPQAVLVEEDVAGFRLEAFFAGSSVSAGRVTTLFVFEETFLAGFSGRVDGDRLRLDERFVFADGERLQRWDLRRVAPDRYSGTVSTERGDGTLGDPVPVDGRVVAGRVVLDYVGLAPGGGTRFRFRHEMTPNPDGTVTNRVEVRRFGFPVARSDVVFAKSPEALRRHFEREHEAR